MNDKQWMIYGANGFSARLAVDEAIKRRLSHILEGRSQSVAKLDKEKG